MVPLIFFFSNCGRNNAQYLESMAWMNYQGKKMVFDLKDSWGLPIPEESLYVPHYIPYCDECSMKMVCNGCSDCGKCATVSVPIHSL